MAGFLFALLLLVAAGGAAIWVANRNIQTYRIVAHTHEVLSRLEQTLTGLLRVESGGRGYAVSGDLEFLEANDRARGQISTNLAELERLVSDNPVQLQRLAELVPVVESKLDFVQRVIEARRTGTADDAFQLIASGEGRKEMDDITTRIRTLQATERDLLSARAEATVTAAQRNIAVVILLNLLGAGFVLAGWMILRRDFRLRREAEMERDRFFNLSLDMFCVAGMDGYFKRLNPAWEATLGFTLSELMQRPFVEFVHPEDRPATEDIARQLAGGSRVVAFENRYLRKDGSYVWLLWNAFPLGERGLIYASARDTTERRLAEQKVRQLNDSLQQQARQLEAANKELEAFSYSVSHDLRAPLRHIQGYADMLQRAAEGQLSEKATRYLRTISEAGNEMGQLIDDLLAFSRDGRSEINLRNIELDGVVRKVIEELEMVTRDRNIVWKISPLPRVKGDPTALRQVFANLIGNAIKYSRNRDPAEIEIGCSGSASDGVVIFVRDNGAGFDMQYVHKLFGVFQRLHRSDEFEGTGIGLATVRRMISRHGGRTWAEGELDRGATFYLTLKPAEPANPATT